MSETVKDIFDQEAQPGDYLVGEISCGLSVGIFLTLTKTGKDPSIVYSEHGSRLPIKGNFLRITPDTIPHEKIRKLEEGFEKACKQYRVRIDENVRRQRNRT